MSLPQQISKRLSIMPLFKIKMPYFRSKAFIEDNIERGF